MNWLQERTYYIQRTQEGIFLVFISARKDDAVGASIQYDGRDHALFLRKPMESIILDYINPTVHESLLKSPFVEMVEMDTSDEEVERDYKVPVKPVPQVTVILKK